MKENIYEVLNEVKTDISDYEECILTQDEKDKILSNEILKRKLLKGNNEMNKKTNNKLPKRLIATAASLLIVATTSLVGVQAFATTNPIAHSIADVFGLNASLDNYATIVSTPITKEGITVSIDEVIYDKMNNKIFISTAVSSENEVIEEGNNFIPHLRLYINGEYMNATHLHTSYKIDESTQGLISEVLLNEEFEGDMDINVEIAGVDINDEYIKEKWEFKFSTNGEELAEKTYSEELVRDFDLGNGTEIRIENFTTNPISTNIYYTTDSLMHDKNIEIVGVDNLGNEVKFVEEYGHAGQGGGLALDSEYTITDDVEYFTLQLYCQTVEEGPVVAEFEAVGEEFTVNLK